MNSPVRPRAHSEPTPTLEQWIDVSIAVPGDINLVRAFNGRNVQKCYYDAGDQKWRNQRGEVIQIIQWKLGK